MPEQQISVNDLLLKIGHQAVLIDAKDAAIGALQAQLEELQSSSAEKKAERPSVVPDQSAV